MIRRRPATGARDPWKRRPETVAWVAFALSLIARPAAAAEGVVVGAVAFVWLALAVTIVVAAAVALCRHASLARRRAEDAHDLVLGALESSPRARMIAGPDGAVVHANKAWKAMVGDDAVAPLATLEDRLDDDDARARLRRLRDAAVTGTRANAEIRLAAPGGGREWRDVTVDPLEHRPGYVLWGMEDITARREMEQVMREEQGRLADFLENAPIGFYSVDRDGRFLFINDTLASWLGSTPPEITGGSSRLHDFIAGAAPPERAPYSPFASADETQGEVTMRGAGDRNFQAFITQTVMDRKDDGEFRTRSLVRDLTAEHDWAEALERSEQRFHRFFDEAPVGIILLDTDGAVTECSASFARMTGTDVARARGRRLADFVAEDHVRPVSDWIAGALADVASSAPLQVELAGADQMKAALFARRLDDGAGKASGLIVHVLDQTEQRKLEEQFIQAQKMEVVGKLAGGVAHDFNNLLTAMIGFCDLLLQRHSAKDPSFGDIMQIKQNANRAANLVRQLLAFSRQQTLQPKVLNVTDVLAEISHLLRRLIGANIELDMIHGRDLGLVRVDKSQLEQVIINLAVNARDAIGENGTLIIRTRNVTAAQSGDEPHGPLPEDDYVALEVSDSGCGIARENLDKIFEPFFTTKEVGSGTGLGLSTVYGIIRQTGGHIFVDSAPGEGARFTIYLPCHEAGADEAEAPADAGPEALSVADLTGVGTVLLVEDEDSVRMFGARALRNKGYSVVDVSSGESALEVLEAGEARFDLVITDVVMPGLDGPGLIRRVREKFPAMKVIFISGYAEDSFRQRLDDSEDVHFLPKPFTLQQLAGKVKEIMEDGAP